MSIEREQLVLYADDECTPEEARLVEEALARSTEARGELARILRRRLMLAEAVASEGGRQDARPGARQRRRTPPPSKGSGSRMVAYVAAAAAVAAGMLVAILLVSGGTGTRRQSRVARTPRVPSPAGREGRSQAGPDHDRGLEKMLESAESFRAEHPDEFGRALSRYEKARDAARGTRFEALADAGVREVREEWKRAALAALSAAKSEGGKLAASGDVDGALAALREIPGGLASQVGYETRAEAERIKADAQRRLDDALASAERSLGSGDADGTRAALAEMERIRFADGRARMAARVESLRARIAGADETRKLAAVDGARRRLPGLLDEFDRLVAGGDYAGARERMEAAAADEALAPIKDTLAAVARVAKTLDERRGAIFAAARGLVGKKTALRTSKGLRRGEVEKIDGKGIILATKIIINGQVRGVNRYIVAWTDLDRQEEDRLAAGWKPAGAEGGMARTILAFGRGDVEAAGKALAAAGGHPLAGRIRRRIDERRLEELGALAAVAWRKIEGAAAKRKLSFEDRAALASKLAEFREKYGATEFAGSMAGEIAAIQKRLAEGTLAAGRHFLRLPDAIHAKTKFLNQEFVFYQPKGVKPFTKMPLFFFLHGINGRGNEIKKLWWGGGQFWKFADKHGLAMVVSQCALGDTTKSVAGKKGDGWWQSADLDLLLEHVASTYNIDRDRIYVTGYSMGAFGTWAWAIDSPQLIAAAVPVCGGGDPSCVDAIKNMPIWAFHGVNDTRVPPSRSQAMVDALKKAGSTRIRFTLQPNTGHSASALSKPEVYEWLVRQSRKGPLPVQRQ
ncbi:MAG: prolyl oligopeptidase family serine peptidase [Planctomycetota bacterium]